MRIVGFNLVKILVELQVKPKLFSQSKVESKGETKDISVSPLVQ